MVLDSLPAAEGSQTAFMGRTVRMTEIQYQQLQRYMEMTRLGSTAYFCRLIQGNEFRGRSSKLNHALHASVNMIYSNVRHAP